MSSILLAVGYASCWCVTVSFSFDTLGLFASCSEWYPTSSTPSRLLPYCTRVTSTNTACVCEKVCGRCVVLYQPRLDSQYQPSAYPHKSRCRRDFRICDNRRRRRSRHNGNNKIEEENGEKKRKQRDRKRTRTMTLTVNPSTVVCSSTAYRKIEVSGESFLSHKEVIFTWLWHCWTPLAGSICIQLAFNLSPSISPSSLTVYRHILIWLFCLDSCVVDIKWNLLDKRNHCLDTSYRFSPRGLNRAT